MPEPVKAVPKSDAKFIWITNNTDTVITIALRPLAQPGSNTLSAPVMMPIFPGATVVDRDVWEQWKKQAAEATDYNEADRLLKGKIPSDPHKLRRSERAGAVFLVEGPPVTDRKLPLAGLEESVCVALVREVQNEVILRDLAAVERRGPVLEALRIEIDKFVRAMRQPAA